MAKRISDCCFYSLKEDGTCHWCGNECEAVTKAERDQDELWHELEMDLVDWNRPSRLFSYESEDVIGSVYRFIKKREENGYQ